MKLNVACTLALTLAIAFVPNCRAQGYMDLLRGLLSKDGSISQSQSAIITNLNNTQAQLDTQIQAGAASGQLSPREENDLRRDLNRIADQQGQYLATGQLNDYNVQNLLMAFNNLNMKLQAYLSNKTVVSTSTYNPGWFQRYGRGGLSGNPADQSRFVANIDTKRAMIDSTINQAVWSGRLNWGDARNFRSELNRINNDENRMMADGYLSYRDSQTLINSLNNLEFMVNAQIQKGQRNWNNNNQYAYGLGSSYVMQRIQRGLSSGQLSSREGNSLMRDAQTLNSLQMRLNTNSGMSVAEQQLLLAQISQLNTQITAKLNERQVH